MTTVKRSAALAAFIFLAASPADAQIFFNTPFGSFGFGAPMVRHYRRPPPPRPASVVRVDPSLPEVLPYQSNADIFCGAPQMQFDRDRSPDTDPVTSVEVSYSPSDHAWRVFLHKAGGDIVSRSEQYAVVDRSDDNKTQWAGSLNRNRSMYMIGEVKFNDRNEPFYYEWLYNREKGNRLEMNFMARCAWNKKRPEPEAPLPQPSSQAPVAPPVAMAEAPRVSPPPVARPAVHSARDSIPLHPGSEGASVLVDVIVGGQPVRMLLDTGATNISVTQDLARRIVAQHQGSWGGTANVRMANGDVIQQRIINIETVIVGSHTVHNVRGSVTDGSTMLLPFPVLNSIAPFKIDTRNNELVFDQVADGGNL